MYTERTEDASGKRKEKKKMSIIQNRLDDLRGYLKNFPLSETDTEPQKALKMAMIHEIEYLETLPH